MPLESGDLLELSRDAEEPTELVLGQLPIELVICIFILACDEQSIEFRATGLGDVGVSAGSTALALAGVCRRWRNISTSVPELWTRLGFLCHGTRLIPLLIDAILASKGVSLPRYPYRASSRPLFFAQEVMGSRSRRAIHIQLYPQYRALPLAYALSQSKKHKPGLFLSGWSTTILISSYTAQRRFGFGTSPSKPAL
jgi:F-box-like